MTRRRERRRRRQISSERKGAYYAGMAMVTVGGLMFFSVFVSHISSFGDFSNFDSNTKSMGVRAVGGIFLIGVGQALMRVGSRGLAGSGVLLDPERARRDVEPWARMGGGVLKDALDEAGVELGRSGSTAASSGAPDDFDERLRKLHRLHEEGILSTEEYEREKREILDSL